MISRDELGLAGQTRSGSGLGLLVSEDIEEQSREAQLVRQLASFPLSSPPFFSRLSGV